jgi:hypothetical protein
MVESLLPAHTRWHLARSSRCHKLGARRLLAILSLGVSPRRRATPSRRARVVGVGFSASRCLPLPPLAALLSSAVQRLDSGGGSQNYCGHRLRRGCKSICERLGGLTHVGSLYSTELCSDLSHARALFLSAVSLRRSPLLVSQLDFGGLRALAMKGLTVLWPGQEGFGLGGALLCGAGRPGAQHLGSLLVREGRGRMAKLARGLGQEVRGPMSAHVLACRSAGGNPISRRCCSLVCSLFLSPESKFLDRVTVHALLLCQGLPSCFACRAAGSRAVGWIIMAEESRHGLSLSDALTTGIVSLCARPSGLFHARNAWHGPCRGIAVSAS